MGGVDGGKLGGKLGGAALHASPHGKLQDNQNETPSPIYVRDRRIKALQVEQNAPLNGFSSFVEDVQDHGPSDMKLAIAAAEAAAERRMRLQSMNLKRFRQQICLRVKERVVRDREQTKSIAKKLDEKFARLLQLPTTVAPLEQKTPCRPLSRDDFVEALVSKKREDLKDAKTALSLVDKAIRADAQVREMLLESTHTRRYRESRDCEPILDESSAEIDQSRVDIPPQQRIELYAAVRRQHMDRERAKVHHYRQEVAYDKALRGSQQAGCAQSEAIIGRRLSPELKVVDVSSGPEFRLHRQAGNSSTPWRKSPSSASLSGISTGHTITTPTRQRFLNALESELGSPSLCSCNPRAKAQLTGISTQCASNCVFY